MLKEAHVRPQPVVCGRQLGAHLRGQLIQLQRPLAQREAANTQQNLKLTLLLPLGLESPSHITTERKCTLDGREIKAQIQARRAAQTLALPWTIPVKVGNCSKDAQ